MAASKKRVLVVDDHPVMREGIIELLNRLPDMKPCGEAANAPQLMARLGESVPDILLLDLRLGHGDGLELIKQLRQFHPNLRILVYSMYDESLYAERVIKAGANGYVMKECDPDQVVAALRQVLRGEIALSPNVRRPVGPPDRADDPVKKALTDRELQVFYMIGSGLKAGQIAQDLSLSVKTIETHCGNIKNKLLLNDAKELRGAAKKWVEDT